MKKLFGLCAAVLLLCAALFPAKTFAADDPNSEGMQAFREALVSDSDALERIFRQDIYFASPFVMSELEILGTVEGNAFKSTGEFAIWAYGDDGSETETIIPYYLTQDGNNMTIYFQTDKQWKKFTAPTLAAAVTDLIATPTADEIEEIIAAQCLSTWTATALPIRSKQRLRNTPPTTALPTTARCRICS